MECKLINLSKRYLPVILVLIETLWNVNLNAESDRAEAPADVLIETLWNVNNIEYVFEGGRGGRINRNIVECK